jgi:hypothetical protein
MKKNNLPKKKKYYLPNAHIFCSFVHKTRMVNLGFQLKPQEQ